MNFRFGKLDYHAENMSKSELYVHIYVNYFTQESTRVENQAVHFRKCGGNAEPLARVASKFDSVQQLGILAVACIHTVGALF